jgi:hypothetical protein
VRHTYHFVAVKQFAIEFCGVTEQGGIFLILADLLVIGFSADIPQASGEIQAHFCGQNQRETS